jgi:DNA polymerase-3 subunit delta
MTIQRVAGLERFLRKPDPGIGAILIYGEDAGAVRDQARRMVEKVAGRIDDPFAVVTLEDGALSSDRGRLADEVQSMSLMGGVRVVWVRATVSRWRRNLFLAAR